LPDCHKEIKPDELATKLPVLPKHVGRQN